ncbi:MAG: Ig-like domain-containing protein, partial [Sphingomonadales bacterium]
IEDAGCNGTAPCTPTDTDNDGIPNYLDLDSDNDGIPDSIEDAGCNGTAPCTPTDTDNDGTPNYLDLDSDNDGIPDSIEDAGCNGTAPCTPTDTDNDGIPNYLDLDSDNDGILDSIEDAGCSGTAPCTPTDTDNDGIPNYLDLDSDNDGCSDANEAYNSLTAQGTDGNMMFGNGNPPTVNSSGQVIGATYSNTNTNYLSAGAAPAITGSPTNQTTTVGATVNFSATASVSVGTITYQWQLSTNGGTSWSNVPSLAPYSGVANPVLTINGVTAAMQGYRYRLIASQNGYICRADTSSAATLSVNFPPDAVNDAVSVAEDVALTGNLLANDTDPNGDPLTVVSFVINGYTYFPGTTATIPNVGTIIINANGTYTFTPLPNYNGTVPPITYTISDGQGGTDTANLSITVTPSNDAPVANNDAVTTPEDTPATGNVLTNDTDIDGNPLTVTQFTIAGISGTFTAGQTATIPGVGTLVINSNGAYTFTPAPNYNGAVPAATYTVSDGQGGTATATLSITVTAVNDAPVANNDVASTLEDTPVSGNVLTNDTDIDGNPLTVTQFTIAGISGTFTAGQTATIPGAGTLVINSNGTYTFTPAPNYNGAVPAATYTVSDGQGGTATATLSIAITPVNDPPVAVNDLGTTLEDQPITGNVLSNDTDIDGNPLTVTQFVIGGVPYVAGSTATIPGVGTIVINSNGSYVFTPAPNYNGTVPPVLYFISDGQGGTASATLQLTVQAVADPEDIQVSSAPVCISGSVILQASSTTIVNPIFRWYADPSLSNLLFTGATYTTPVINVSTTYYVTVSGSGVLQNQAGNGRVS